MSEINAARGIVPGSVVEVGDFLGGSTRVIVTETFDDIKNGRPGFDGFAPGGDGVWRYTDQVTRVIAAPVEA